MGGQGNRTSSCPVLGPGPRHRPLRRVLQPCPEPHAVGSKPTKGRGALPTPGVKALARKRFPSVRVPDRAGSQLPPFPQTCFPREAQERTGRRTLPQNTPVGGELPAGGTAAVAAPGPRPDGVHGVTHRNACRQPSPPPPRELHCRGKVTGVPKPAPESRQHKCPPAASAGNPVRAPGDAAWRPTAASSRAEQPRAAAMEAGFQQGCISRHADSVTSNKGSSHTTPTPQQGQEEGLVASSAQQMIFTSL